jgi:hypothetical protein
MIQVESCFIIYRLAPLSKTPTTDHFMEFLSLTLKTSLCDFCTHMILDLLGKNSKVLTNSISRNCYQCICNQTDRWFSGNTLCFETDGPYKGGINFPF